MFSFLKNRIISLGILLGLACLLVFGYAQSRIRPQVVTPDYRADSVSQKAIASPTLSDGMATNVPPSLPEASYGGRSQQEPRRRDSPTVKIPVQEKTPGATPVATVSLTDIKACMTKPIQQIGKCYDDLFREFLKTHTTADALKIVAQYEDTDAQLRYACHPVVHAIGRETFAKLHTVHDSFVACDQTCHSGCYHGAMERFIRGDQSASSDGAMKHISDAELEAKITTACPADQASRFRFQCLHGLGHALLFSLEYKLEQTLQTCDKLGTPWDRSSCWGGAFMENLFPSDPTKSDVSAADYHYPCSKLDAQYKSDCYVMQTTRMTTMGLDAHGLFTECRKAGVYALSCIQSIGRDLSNDARIKDPRPTAQKCELGQNEDERQACTRGVIYAVIDNTWDGRYAFPFCQSFANEPDRAYCTTASAKYLHATYDKAKEAILDDCMLRIKDQAICADAVKEL